MTALTSTVTLDTPTPTTARARGGGLAAVATLARRASPSAPGPPVNC